MENKSCYGRYEQYSKHQESECKDCELAEWCKDSSDPKVNNNLHAESIIDNESTEFDYDNFSFYDIEQAEIDKAVLKCEEIFKKGGYFIVHSSEMAPLVNALQYQFTHLERAIIYYKMSNPNISLPTIGKKFKMSKQAIDTHIKKILEFAPALTGVLRNRPEFNKWRHINEEAEKAGKFNEKNKIEQLNLFEEE